MLFNKSINLYILIKLLNFIPETFTKTIIFNYDQINILNKFHWIIYIVCSRISV